MAEPAPAEAAPRERHVVLVTGASGLVGRALRAVVEEESAGDGSEWVWLRSADGDLCNAADVAALFDKHRPTHVVHLAAHVGGLFANMVRAPADACDEHARSAG
jgi:GDP-L-fucose synthase